MNEEQRHSEARFYAIPKELFALPSCSSCSSWFNLSALFSLLNERVAEAG
jgi:hypothetical protein